MRTRVVHVEFFEIAWELIRYVTVTSYLRRNIDDVTRRNSDDVKRYEVKRNDVTFYVVLRRPYVVLPSRRNTLSHVVTRYVTSRQKCFCNVEPWFKRTPPPQHAPPVHA